MKNKYTNYLDQVFDQFESFKKSNYKEEICPQQEEEIKMAFIAGFYVSIACTENLFDVEKNKIKKEILDFAEKRAKDYKESLNGTNK